MDDAVFRPESSFKPANLLNILPFWESKILKDHPHKQKIVGWLKGVRIEEFLNSFTTSIFQGEELNSYYPKEKHFENYVPQEFFGFIWSWMNKYKNG